MLFKNYWGSIGCWWTCPCLSLIFIKMQQLRFVLEPHKLLMSWFFSKKELFLISGLKFTLSRVTFFLPDNVSGIPKFIFRSGFGKHWASGAVKENKYHTVYTATIVERESVLCLLHYDYLINNLLIIWRGMLEITIMIVTI